MQASLGLLRPVSLQASLGDKPNPLYTLSEFYIFRGWKFDRGLPFVTPAVFRPGIALKPSMLANREIIERIYADLDSLVCSDPLEKRDWTSHHAKPWLDFFSKLMHVFNSIETELHRHTLCVTVYARLIGEHMLSKGVDADDISDLVVAALVHDFGKIATPIDVLLKPKELTKSEWETIQGHVEKGVELLKRADVPERVIEIVATHHEKLDGSGYPRGLTAIDLPKLFRILPVADIFSALTEKRVYRDWVSTAKEAYDYLVKEANKGLLDVEIVKVFGGILQEGIDYKLLAFAERPLDAA